MPKHKKRQSKKFTKKQLALIRRVLKMKGLPKNLRHMLLVLLGATLKPSKSKHKKSKSHKKKGGKRASAAQMRVRRKFKAFIRKHGRPPRKGEHL